ncbi:leucine-rich repeat domain-containing protein [Listeria rustica]|uniref:Leucine-rich repeat domain-containing protein n=1 Tax=Listeria rustica TaxID=2713503 RepID=A0A7W1T4N7_9LIST|nr:hypothetical protein [Listeria rustica]MBA3925451.1 hypothetical protein [Listeria rustica]
MKKKLGITVLITALIIPSMTWASEESTAPTKVPATEVQEHPETVTPTNSVTTDPTETATVEDNSLAKEKSTVVTPTSPATEAETGVPTEVPVTEKQEHHETVAPTETPTNNKNENTAAEEVETVSVAPTPTVEEPTTAIEKMQKPLQPAVESTTENQPKITPATTSEDPVVEIPDFDLRCMILLSLGFEDFDMPITQSMMESLTDLQTSAYDTTGLEYAVNLRHLKFTTFLWGENIDDNMARILHLNTLESLEFNNFPENYSLAPLTHLRELTVDDVTFLSNLNFLAENKTLEKLNLGGGGSPEDKTHLEDISALRKLTSLTSLSLYQGNLDPLDLSPILALSNLETLKLNRQDLQDVSFLAPLSHLKHLDLTNNAMTQTDSIRALPSLQSVNLTNNHLQKADITDIDVTWDGNFIPGKPNQYKASLPTETTELASIGDSTTLPVTWTYNDVPVEVEWGRLKNSPFSEYPYHVTISPAILTSKNVKITSIPVTATADGLTTVTSELVPGYKVQTKVRVLGLPKPPRLMLVSSMQDTLHGTTSPNYRVKVVIEGETYQAVADEKGVFAVKIGLHLAGSSYAVTAISTTGIESTPVHATILDGAIKPPQINPVTVGIQEISGRISNGPARIRILVDGVVQREITTTAGGYFSVPSRNILDSSGKSRGPLKAFYTVRVDYGPDTPKNLITECVVVSNERPTTLYLTQANADYITGQTLPGSQTLRLTVNGIMQRVITPRSTSPGQIMSDGYFKIYSRFNLDSDGQLSRLKTGDTITVDSGIQLYGASHVEIKVQ